MNPPEDAVRILVVDDERAITDLVAMALKYEGFAVATAASARLTAKSQPRVTEL